MDYTAEKIAEILELHAKYLRGEPEGERANLSRADLSRADLRYANLSRADLSGADLSDANLRYVNLRYANLRGADLSDANLRYVNLRYANLRYANLRYANLRYANLRYANLSGADLRGADLSGAESIIRISSCDGYDVILVEHDDGPRIGAGCRWFTVDEARKHWCDPTNATPRSSVEDGVRHCRLMLTAVAALLELAQALGWQGIPKCGASRS